MIGRSAVGLLVALWVGAAAAELPRDAPARHLGVTVCSTALCHNAVAPWRQGGARLDEYRIWRRDDAHARAYEVLRGEAGQRIGRRFGVATPEQAPVCLDCHADRAANTGPQHTVRDGVACEVCHGGAERWLDSHAHGASHQDNLARGMYPTDDPVRRAELCVSCHVGTTRTPLTHRLLAAGHPRLVFELDTFTVRQPPHAVEDDDYRARKPVPSSAELWAVGQGVVAQARAALLASPATWSGGVWPELSVFDCGTCHRDATAGAGDARHAPGTRPGLPRLDASLLGWLEILAHRDPSHAAALGRAWAALDAAVAGSTPERVRRAATVLEQVTASTTRWLPIRLDRDDVEVLLRRIADCDHVRPAPSYLEAEQLAMAAQALVATRTPSQHIADDPRLAPLFDRTRRFWGFGPAAFVKGLQGLCAGR